MKASSAWADVRSLGPTAPLRAGYELSKLLGGHDLVFRGLALRPARDRVASTLLLPGTDSVPEAALRRATDEALLIASGQVRLFGQDLTVEPGSWNRAWDTGSDWPGGPWWRIDIRSDERPADVKWTWELGRSRHLVVLARAAGRTPGAASVLEAQLRSWLTQNPLEQGVHWYSNLELALRAVSWLQVLHWAGHHLTPKTRSGMERQLWHTGRHLLADLPYSVSSMRNNHLLGDGLGLIALGQAFRGRGAGPAAWLRVGGRVFDTQLARHVLPDGSMVEDSLSYHRFVLEMLVVRVLLGAPSRQTRDALLACSQHLVRLGVLEGPVPQYGDWDEGRVLASSQGPQDVAGSVRLALALSGTGAPASWREEHDECAWYVGDGEPAAAVDRSGLGLVGNAFSHASVGPWTVWLKAGGGPSHGHADATALSVRHQEDWVLGDPGTGTYNGPLEQRNAFRSSRSHSVLRVGRTDQLEPVRAFRWRYAPTGCSGRPLRSGHWRVLWAGHRAYARLVPGRRVVRVVLVSPAQLVVADHVEGSDGVDWDLCLPFAPAAAPRLQPDGWQVDLGTRHLQLVLPCDARAVRGERSPYDGWWSTTYGSAVPTTFLRLEGRDGLPVVWSLAEHDAEPEQAALEADVLQCGSLRVEVSFRPTDVVLQLVDAGRTSRSYLELAP